MIAFIAGFLTATGLWWIVFIGWSWAMIGEMEARSKGK